METKLNLGDVSIVPATKSYVESREECLVTYENGQSPYMVAPMDTVIDEKNWDFFLESGLNVCLPRGVDYPKGFVNNTPNLLFESMSLSEFKKKYCVSGELDEPIYNFTVLIDIANGHMADLIDSCTIAKRIWGDDLILMVGNIANPETVGILSEIGVDYVRVGIGGGSACTTTTHTGVHYPMASLIKECAMVADVSKGNIKIVADGGIRSTADVNIALACGADFVMMGQLFNQCIESCSTTYWRGIPLKTLWALYMYEWGFDLYKKYRGMSTTAVQKKWGKQNIRLSEGIHKKNKVLFDLEDLLYHLNHRLKTAMSYTGCFYLEDYTSGKVQLIRKTYDTNIRVNKL
jgi:GMP reductase